MRLPILLIILLSISANAIPPNDSLPNARIIRSNPTLLWQSDTLGITDPGDEGRTIWFRWNADKTEQVFIELRQASSIQSFNLGPFDPGDSYFEMTAFTGNTLDSLVETGEQIIQSGYHPAIVLNAQAGQNYQIRVRTTSSANFPLSLPDEKTPPLAMAMRPLSEIPGDRFEEPIQINNIPARVLFNNIGATLQDAEPSPSGLRSVWFRWVAPKSTEYAIDLFGSIFDHQLDLFEGNDLSTLTFLQNDTHNLNETLEDGARLIFSATKDQTYHFRVSAQGNSAGNGTFNLCEISASENHNSPETAHPIQSLGSLIHHATHAKDTPATGSVFYTLTPSNTGTYHITGRYLGSRSDLWVYEKENPEELIEIDEVSETYTLDAGVTYLIEVDIPNISPSRSNSPTELLIDHFDGPIEFPLELSGDSVTQKIVLNDFNFGGIQTPGAVETVSWTPENSGMATIQFTGGLRMPTFSVEPEADNSEDIFITTSNYPTVLSFPVTGGKQYQIMARLDAPSTMARFTTQVDPISDLLLSSLKAEAIGNQQMNLFWELSPGLNPPPAFRVDSSSNLQNWNELGTTPNVSAGIQNLSPASTFFRVVPVRY